MAENFFERQPSWGDQDRRINSTPGNPAGGYSWGDHNRRLNEALGDNSEARRLEQERQAEPGMGGITLEEYRYLRDQRESGIMSDEEMTQTAAAIRLSRELNTSVEWVLENLDALFQDDHAGSPRLPRTNAGSIIDSWKVGRNTTRLSELGNRWAQAEARGDQGAIKEIEAAIQLIEEHNRSLQDTQPRGLTTRLLQEAAGTVDYMAKVFVPSAAGSLLNPFVGFAAGAVVGSDMAAGLEYISLRQAGISGDIARRTSRVSGIVQGVTEQALGLIPGAAAGGLRLMGAKFAMPNMAGSLTKKILDRMGTRGVFWQAAVSLGLRTVTGAAEEGLEEALQEGASAAGRNYAAREENERRANIRAEQYEEAVQALGEGYSAAAEGEIRKIIDLDPLLKALPEEEIGQIFNNMVEAFTAGARVSLVLGVVPAGLNLGADIREYLAVQRDGISNPSQEAFIKNTLEKPHLWEDVPEETRREAAEQIYQSLAEDREANLAEEAEAAAEVGDYAPGTETFDDRDRPLGEVFRHNGRIHTEFGTAELEDGRTVETFKGGDGSRETRSNRYGTIFFSREGDEVRIHGIRMAPGREGLLPEFYRDFAETQAEKNIVWNPRSERAREIKADLERRTPEGGKGLNYFSGPEQAATAGRRARLAEQIVRLTKGKATALQAEVAIKELEILGKAGANAEAREVLDWFDITDAVPEGAEKAAAAAQDEGKIVKGLTQPLQNGRALVYLFENADASTLFHEFFHVAQLHFTAEQIGAALKAMGRETWDTAAKEDLARQFEGYLRTGEAPAAELKTLFDKIKEFMRAVYETLTGRIAVKPEVKEFFDQLHRGELSPKNAQNSPGETKTYRNSTEDPQASSEAPRTLSGGIVEGGAPYARSNGAWDMLDTPGIREFYDSLSPEEKAAFNRDREKNENRELKNKNANKKITPTPVQPGVGDDFSMLDKLGREAYTPFKEWVLEINPNKAINTETGLPFNFHARPEPKEGGAAVKSEKRTKEKIQEDREQNILKGKPELLDAQMENVLDYVGFTLTFDTIEELNNFADEIIQRPEVVRAKDRFRDSDLFTGYRDYLLNVKMPNGFVGELQLNVNGMLAAKEQKYGHSLYEITRDYWKYVRDGKMTAEEKAYDEAFINNIARELYDRAYAYALAERDFSTSGRDIPKHSEALGENPPDGFNDLSSITKNHLIPLLAKIEWSSATNLNSGSSNDGTTSLGSVLGEDLTNRNSGDSEAGASSLAISATSTPSITPIIGQNAGNVKGNVDISGIPPIREKYQKAKKTEGFEDTKNVGGEEIEGRWILTEAETPTASHDETTFNETRGFPSANGATINDRDYRHDQAAQEAVVKMAAGYDSRALEGVVITEDGIVISGNNRTMSGKLAAKNGTDGKYIASLEKKAKKYGFTAEQVREYTHPRLVFEVAVKGDYSTELFAQFNQSTRKAQSPVETAVKMAKRLSEKPQVARGIANTIDEHDTLAELYSDKKAVQEIFNILQKNGLIGAYEVPQYVDERGTITGAGVDLLESVMLGSVLNEGNIRGLQGSPAMRQKLVRGITALVENKAMGDYSFIPEMNEAVGIALAVHNTVGKDGKRIYGTVQDYVKQQILPGMPAGLSVEKRASIQLAEALESGGQKDFTLWFGGLNAQLAGAARGQAELLTGEVESKESILDRYVGYREKITERKEANQKTLTTPEAGLAAKTEAALDDAGIAKADAEGTLFQAAYHGTPHQVDRFSTEKIGTGEGAQAYGWGLYFAGRKEIADHYRKNLSLPKITIDGITYQRDHRNTQVYGTVAGTEFNEPVDTEGPLFYALVTLEGEDGNIEAAKTDIQMAILNDKHSKELIKLDKEALKILGKDIGYEAGHLYEVSIPEDDELLDWDKPLSEQPEKVKAALKNLAKSMPPGVFTESLQPFENTSGDGLYNALSRDTGSDKAASEALLSVGIPGLRYLDGSSRAAGKGSYNYVIFDDSEIEIAQTLFQTEEPSTPGKPWPENFPNVTQMSTVAKMKAHGDYAAAKAGDRDAAARLVLDIMGGKGQQEKLKALGEKHPDAIVVGVHAEERSGRNAIPRVLSEYIAKATGLEVDTDIVQSVKAGHTGSDAWRRMANRAQFDGEVQQGRKYILVDDVVTGGGTFGELRRYIEMNGGEVVDMVSMGAAQFSTNIALSEKTRLDLESRYGVELLQQFLQEEGLYGGEYRALTESEARTLLAAGSLDAARNRIAQARQQGNPRILQGSVQGRETPGNPQQVSPQLPKNNNPSTLFQLDESLLEDAARYDTWQDFREAYENQGESAVPSAGDAAWYETFWKDARKALGLPVEPQTLFQTGSKPAGPPERGDRNFLLDVDRETLNQILAALNKALFARLAEPEGGQDRTSYDAAQALKTRINRELPHRQAWIGAAAKAGEKLSSEEYKTLRGYLRDSPRDYRALFADLMDRPEWAVDLADTSGEKLNTHIADPRLYQPPMEPQEALESLAEELDNPEIARRLRDGGYQIDDPELIGYINSLDAQIKAGQAKIAELNTQVEQDNARFKQAELKEILSLYDEMKLAEERLTNHSDKTARLLKRGIKLTAQNKAAINYRSKYDAFNDYVEGYRDLSEVKEALAARDARWNERARLQKLQRERRRMAQDEGKIVKGLTQPLQNGRALVYLFENADASTLFHEFFHVAQLHFMAEQIGAALKAMGREAWDTAAKEDLARQFEGYLRTGEAPAAELKTLFDKIKESMRAVYETPTGRIAVKPEVKEFFDRLHRGELSPKNAQKSPGKTKTYRTTEAPQASPGAPGRFQGEAGKLIRD